MTAFVQMLLVLLLQSTALLLLGLLALHLARKRGPAVQSLVGRASLVSVALLVLLLPLTGHVPPVVRVPEPTPQQAILPEREGAEVRAKTVGALLAAPSDIAAPLPQNGKTREEGKTQTEEGQTQGSAPTPRPPYQGGQALALRVASAALGGFLSVSALLLLWLAVCQWHLTRLRRAAQAITTGPAVTLLAELTPSPPCLLTHPSVHSPFLAGYNRPVIFLPTAFETDFDADALRAIFVHELAHRDRRDNTWTLAARLLTALLWPQPLLWLLVRRLEHSSEDACDEAVLAHHCPPRAYADCLLSLATRPPLRRSQRTLNAGFAPFRSSVGRRISRILTSKGDRPMSPITLRLRLSIAALTVAAALSGAFLVSSAPAQDSQQVLHNAFSPGSHQVLGQSRQQETEMGQAQFLAGLTPVQGPGVVVTLTDSKKRLPTTLPPGITPPNLIHDTDINQVVNELKAAGAEAIAVNGQRLVAISAIRTAGPTILINSVPQAPPFVIQVIGDPKMLTSALNLPGGIASIFKNFDPAMFSIRQAQMLTLPAYSGSNEPRYAKPVSAEEAQTAQPVVSPVPTPQEQADSQFTGRIVYENGQPAPGVIVDARLTSNSVAALTRRGQKVQDVKMGAEATTQADGSYRLSDLTAGCSYDIIEREASGEWVARAIENVPLSQTTTHAPTLILTHGAVITGTVINKKTGQPMPEMSVLSLGPRYPASMGGSSSTRTDAGGKYLLRIVPGDNWIYISGTDANANYVTGQIGVSPLSTNLKYPQYEHGFHVVILAGETKAIPIYAILPAAPAHL